MRTLSLLCVTLIITQSYPSALIAADSSPTNRLVVKAPATETRTNPVNVCAADFFPSAPLKARAIETQLSHDPAALNRLSPIVVKPGAEPVTWSLTDLRAGTSPLTAAIGADSLAVVVGQPHQELALIWGQKWPNGTTLHVRFLNTDPSWSPVKQKVEQFAHQWEQYANIKFAFDNQPDAQIRILLSTDGLSWSDIGTDASTEAADHETMHFGWFTLATDDTEYSRTVLHEFGHALGAIHEHQHPDNPFPWNKEAVYAFYASQTPPWSKEMVDANMFKKYDRSILQYGNYDKDSIMEYPIPPTFLTNPKYAVGWNTKLSDEDKQVISWVYPKSQP